MISSSRRGRVNVSGCITHFLHALVVPGVFASFSAASPASFTFVELPDNVFPGTHFPTHLVAADLDSDGFLDVVVPGRDTDGFAYILWGNGDGTFGEPQAIFIDEQTDYAAVADMDGDGVVDLVFGVRGYPAGVAVVLNNGARTFAIPETLVVGREMRSVVTSDFDGDGDSDVVALDYAGGQLLLLRNDSTGPGSVLLTHVGSIRLNADTSGFVNPQHLLAADLDGDRRDDLVATTIGGRRVTVLLNRSSGGSFEFTAAIGHRPPVIERLRPAVTNSVVGDMDGDGDLDIVSSWITGFSLDQLVGVLLNGEDGEAAGSFGLPVSFTTAFNAISWVPAVGDFDNDGDLDVAVGYGLPGPITLSENLGLSDGAPTFGPAQTIPAGSFVRAILPIDIDGDGDIDLIYAEAPSDRVTVLLNQLVPGVPSGGIASQDSEKAIDPDARAQRRPTLLSRPLHPSDSNRDGEIGSEDLAIQLGLHGGGAPGPPPPLERARGSEVSR